MKKVLNILGYISILLIPYIRLVFYIFLYDPVKIIGIIGLMIIIFMQVVHFKNTKVKYIGIRILITILIFSIIIFIATNIYGIIKTIEIQKIWDKVDRIQYESYTLEKEEIDNIKLELVKERFILYKGRTDATLYYNDGTEEKIEFLGSANEIIVIKGHLYYYNKIY